MRKKNFLKVGFLLLAIVGISLVAYAQTEEEQRQLDFANGLFQRGVYDMAAEEYRAYLKEFPHGKAVKDVLYRLGEAEYSSGDLDSALVTFTKFLEQESSGKRYARALLRKGEILYRLKRYKEAIPVLQQLAGGTDDSVRVGAMFYLGRVYLDSGDPAKAAAILQQIVDRYGDDSLIPYVRYHLGFAQLALHKTEEAAMTFSALAEMKTADTALRIEGRLRAAEAYDKLGWFDAAAKAYQQLRKDYPGTAESERALYGYAWALYHAGKYKEAVQTANNFLKTNAQDSRVMGVRYLRANCFQQLKQYEDALREYQAICQKASDSDFAVRSRYKIAWVWYLQGKKEQAEKAITDFLDQYTNSPFRGDAIFLLGMILADKKAWEDAYEEFRLVAEKYGNSEFAPEALFWAGKCLQKLDREKESVETFKKFIRRYPTHPLAEKAALHVADTDFFAAAFGEAIKRYQQILANHPEPEVEIHTLYRMAITYHNMQEFQKSAETFQKLLEKDPDGAHAAEAHLRIGTYLLLEKKQAIDAIAELQKAYDIAPDGPFAGDALKWIGLARYASKDFAGAADVLLRLTHDFPKEKLNEATYAWMGEYFYQKGQWDKAIDAFQVMLKVFPDYPAPARVHFRIAQCHEQAGRIDKAIKLYEAVVKEAPRSEAAVNAFLQMARLAEKKGDMKQAITFYTKAARGGTSDAAAQAQFHLGEIYEKREAYYDAARAYMRIAILLMHERLSPESLWRAGQCFEKAGKVEQAKKAYSELVTDFPDSDQAEKAKERLQQLAVSKTTPVGNKN